MFDTLNLFIDRSDIIEGNPFVIAQYLDEVLEHSSNKFGYSCSGSIGDYKVCCFQNGISLKGSLAKYYLPSNLFTLTRSAAQEAIEQMSDVLHLDISTAKVTRLDISTIIPTLRPPQDYYSSLGAKKYFERLQATNNTLYYNNHKQQLVFYDKTKEAQTKGSIIPPIFEDKNLLRYELRYTKRLNKQLNKGCLLQAKDLYEQNFYYNLIQTWRDEFKAIKKINQINTIMKDVSTPKDAQKALFAKLLQQGGQSMIDDYIADLRASKSFADPKYYTRLKSDLHKILQAPQEVKSDLIKELEKSIDEVAKYAR